MMPRFGLGRLSRKNTTKPTAAAVAVPKAVPTTVSGENPECRASAPPWSPGGESVSPGDSGESTLLGEITIVVAGPLDSSDGTVVRVELADGRFESLSVGVLGVEGPLSLGPSEGLFEGEPLGLLEGEFCGVLPGGELGNSPLGVLSFGVSCGVSPGWLSGVF